MQKLNVHRLIVTLLTLVALWWAEYSVAQANVSDPSFTNVSLSDLESLDGVFAVAQDQQGFMWFGGKNGLRRYDGYTVDIFRHNPQDPRSLSSNDVSDIFLDSKGRLWVALLSGGGLNRFDYASQSFVHYQKNNTDPHSIGSADIYALAEDKSGNLWLATHDNGLNRLDHSTGYFKRYAIALPGAQNGGVRDIAIDNLNNIWAATNSQGLYKINAERDQFIHYGHDENDVNSLSDNKLYKVFFDRYNNLWLGTVSGGADLFDQAKGQFIHYKNDSNKKNTIGTGMVWDIAEDANGGLWFATGSGILSRYNKWKNAFDNFYPDADNRSRPSGKTIKMFLDADANFWLGSYFSKVNIANEQGDKFKVLEIFPKNNSLKNKSITALDEDSLGNIWFSTIDGFAKIEEKNIDPVLLTGNVNIDALMVDNKDHIWVSSDEGIDRYNPNTHTFKRVSLGFALEQKNIKVWNMMQDSQSKIWIATQSHGLIQVDPTGQNVEVYKHDITEEESLSHSYVWTVFEDSKQRLWVGTLIGLNLLNKESNTFTTFIHDNSDKNTLVNDSVRAIAEDRAGNLFIGTSSGLSVYDPESNVFENYGVSEGLEDESITSLVVDEKGFLWLTTQKGISRFNPIKKQFKNYDVRHGIVGGAYPRKASALLKKDGSLLFSGVFGITTVNIDTFKENTSIPPTVLTSLYVNGKKVTIDKAGILKQDIRLTKDISLTQKDNVFSVEFSALNYVLPEQNKYQYKLVGFDESWQLVGSKQRRATYTNLDSGNYTFLVKGSNNEGVWNESPTQLKIQVMPPWWFSLWAVMLYSTAILFVFGMVWSIQKNRKKVNAQLAKKIREIEQQKQQFLENISTELTPPLNTIIGLTDNILKDSAGDVPQKIRQHLILIKQKSHKLSEIARDMLDYSVFSPSGENLNLRSLCLDQILEGITKWFQPKAEEKSLKLYLSIEGDLPQIKADYGCIQKVLFNMIDNAIKHTDHGYVDVIARRVDESVLIQIADTGEGISGDKIKTLFVDSYSQAGSNENHNVGLAYIKKLIELNGGSIYLDSTSDKGSIFVMHFPIAHSPEDD